MMTSDIIDWNNWKKVLAKFSQVNFRKRYNILDQFDKSIEIHIKIFEAAGLLGPPPQVGLKGNVIITARCSILFWESNFPIYGSTIIVCISWLSPNVPANKLWFNC